jgi:hypothetical protein
MVSGYLHPDYAESLSEFGSPRFLPQAGGWILEREIEGRFERDATGCYPLFSCRDWSQLPLDLNALGKELVSIALVTDPFGEYDEAYLKDCFKDVVMFFKEHFVVDLTRIPDSFVSEHHRRNARKALREVNVEECGTPLDFLEDWMRLYSVLIKRHAVKGIAAFSRDAFAKQLAVPGITLLRAVRDGVSVGMLVWYVQGEVAYYHLGAYCERGYDLHASFALFSYAIERFASCGVRWLNLGAGAGAAQGVKSGLTRFKEGWATGVRPVYLCGRVFDRAKYDDIVKTKHAPPTKYFPAYRVGEFA